MKYVYEAILKREVDAHYDGYSVVFLDWGSATCGVDLREAAEMATDLLRSDLTFALANGNPIPKANFGHNTDGGTPVFVAVDVSLEEAADEWGWMSAKDAATELGVSAGRVRVMANTGVLPIRHFGRDVYVLKAAVNERKRNPRGPGRLRELATA